MGVQIRFDLFEGGPDPAAFLAKLQQYAEPTRWCCVRETNSEGDNPHVHIYIQSARSDADVRNWITRNFKSLKKDRKCVKVWGDEDEDLAYLFKGKDADTLPNVVAVSSYFTFPKQVELHALYWRVNRERAAARQAGNLTETLLAACKAAGVRESHDVIKVFLQSRVGRDGVCPFKHGPAIRSAYLALNGEWELLQEINRWDQKIFGM